MRKKEIMTLVVVAGLIIILLIILGINSASKKEEENVTGGQESNQVEEEFVNVLSDGTKVNTSDKLKETKTFDGLEISGITIVEKDNLSDIVANISNNTSGTIGDYPVTVKVLDKTGAVLVELGGYIPAIPAGGTSQLLVSGTADFANAYDFEIVK